MLNLTPEIVGDDLVGEVPAGEIPVPPAQLPQPLGPVVGLVAGDAGGQILAGHAGERTGLFHHAFEIRVDGGDDPVLGALVPQVAGQGAGVDPLDADDAVLPQIVPQAHGGPPVGIFFLVFLDDETGQVETAALHVLGVDAGVADLGVGHGDHLPLVGGVGEDFLVAGHGGVEHHLAGCLAGGAE